MESHSDELFTSVETKLTEPLLGERHKKINQLVRETPPEAVSAEMLRENMSKMKQVDLVLIGRLANHTKNPNIICELLKSEDSMVLSIALQSKWFFTASPPYQDMANVEYFDREIFPYTSYHAVCRIVSTFSAFLQNHSVAEHFYNYVYEWYGRELAVKLLPKCSLSFIRSQIMESLSDIPPAQMYYIYKKDQTLALEYLEKYLKKEKADKLPRNYTFNINYDKTWRQLAGDNPELFFNLFNKYPDALNIKVGQRAVKEILKNNSNNVIENLVKHSTTIPKKHVINNLKGEDLEKYLLNCLPEKESTLLYYQNEFLNLKPKYRYKMLNKLYPLKYKDKQFIDREDFPEWNLIEYLSNNERLTWIKKKMETVDTNDIVKREYYKYLDGEEAMQFIKNACNNTTVWEERSQFINGMVESCKINDDLDLLLRLMKYVYDERKDDHSILCQSFLKKVKECFVLHKLSTEHWEIIQNLIDFLTSNRYNGFYFWGGFFSRILQDYLHYCLTNGIEIDLLIDKLISLDFYHGDIIMELRKQGFDEKIVSLFLEKYPKIIEATKERKKSAIVYSLVTSFNYKKDNLCKITDYPWLLDYFQKYFNSFYNDSKIVLYKAIQNDPKIRELYLNTIFKCVSAPLSKDSKTYSETYTTIDKNVNFVKNIITFNQEIINTEVDYFVKLTVTYKSRTFKFDKVYQKIQIYQKQPLGERLIKVLEENMNKTDVQNSQEIAICSLYLCYLSPSNKHCEIVRQHNPYNKINRKIFGKYLKTLNPPISFDILSSSFENGTFLKSYLPSLTSIPFKKSKLESKMFIESLFKSVVPAKKLAIRLSYVVYPRKDLLPLYKSMWSNEKNSSMREVLYSFTYKLLKSEENIDNYKQIWETLKNYMTTLNENDLNIFKYLTKPHEIMPEFVDDYSQTCWKTLNDFKLKNIDVEIHRSALLKNLSPCMELLNEQFRLQMEELVIISDETNESVEDFNFNSFGDLFS